MSTKKAKICSQAIADIYERVQKRKVMMQNREWQYQAEIAFIGYHILYSLWYEPGTAYRRQWVKNTSYTILSSGKYRNFARKVDEIGLANWVLYIEKEKQKAGLTLYA